MYVLRRWAPVFLAVWLLLPTGTFAYTLRSTSLFIDEEQAVVTQFIDMHLRKSEQVIHLSGIPDDVDLSTLMIYDQRSPLDIVSWWRDGKTAWSIDEGMRWRDRGLVLLPGVTKEVRPGGRTSDVHIRLRSYHSGFRTLQLIYTTRKIHWNAEYYLKMHGRPEDTHQVLTVDMTGFCVISNGTGIVYPDASVRVAGSNDPGDEPFKKEPGMLMVNRESPLSELWLPKKARKGTEYVCPLEGRHLLSSGETKISILHVSRAVARFECVMSSDEAVKNDQGRGAPLMGMLRLERSANAALNMPLPAGRVTLARSGAFQYHLTKAYVPFSGVGRDFEVDIGLVKDIRVFRSSRRREGRIGGWEEAYDVLIDNRLTSAVQVRLNERPAYQLGWNLLRSSEPCQRVGGALQYETLVPAESKKRISYDIYYNQPQW